MVKFFEKKLSLISFVFLPIIFLWNPHWLGFLGVQPYWPLFWLLPWSIIHGSTNGLIVGLFLGLTLDSITVDNTFTQVPGLVLCGVWFGRLKFCTNIFVEHFRYGLICSIASFFCGALYFFQIFINDISVENLFLLSSNMKIVFAQVFVTGLLAPLFCSRLLILFKKSKDNRIY